MVKTEFKDINESAGRSVEVDGGDEQSVWITAYADVNGVNGCITVHLSNDDARKFAGAIIDLVV